MGCTHGGSEAQDFATGWKLSPGATSNRYPTYWDRLRPICRIIAACLVKKAGAVVESAIDAIRTACVEPYHRGLSRKKR